MSLVTLGSVPYSPYNTSLAEMAVTGMKLGMENLDRMEENDRFSLSETSKAFAAVTDNLFKGQTLQLQKKESDRADRAQSFREYEFGEKMAFDKGRAAVGDSQWLKTYDLEVKQFSDTQKRTLLAEKDFGLREKEFDHTKRVYEEAAPQRGAAMLDSMTQSISRYMTPEIERASAQSKQQYEGTKELLDGSNDRLSKLNALYGMASGYNDDTTARKTDANGNPFVEPGTSTTAPPPATLVTPGAPPAQQTRTDLQNLIPQKDGTSRKHYSTAEIEDIKKRIEKEDNLNKALSQHMNMMTNDPNYFGTTASKTAAKKIQDLFAEREGEGIDKDVFDPKRDLKVGADRVGE
jgi:hypothetical protein